MTSGMTAALGIGGTFMTLAGETACAVPYVGAVFISLSTLLGTFGGGPDPTVAMQNAMNELTGYINEQVALLEDYADEKLLQYHKEYLREQYIALFSAVTNCIEYHPMSSQSAIDCLQQVVIQQIDPQRITFAQYETYMSKSPDSFPSGKWNAFYDYEDMRPFLYSTKFCTVDYPERCPDIYSVKDFEASAATFGRYASLHLFVLTGMFYEYMNNTAITNNNTAIVIKILKDIRENGHSYKDYAAWLYQWTYLRQYESSAGCVDRCVLGMPGYCSATNGNADVWEDCMPQNIFCDEVVEGWEGKHHTYNSQTCRARCNEFDSTGFCETSLWVHVDGNGDKWEHDNPDVWHYMMCDPHDLETAPSDDRANTIEHYNMLNRWCINGKSDTSSDSAYGYDDYPYLGPLKSDLKNWWKGHLLQSARAWGDLADAVDVRLAALGYPQEPWDEYPFPTRVQ